MRSPTAAKSRGEAKVILAVAALIPALRMQRNVSAEDLGRKAGNLWDVLEQKIKNPAWPVSGPYDLVAKVIFTQEDGQTRKIEMFYAGAPEGSPPPVRDRPNLGGPSAERPLP